ncbi:hypothetical protein H0H81_010163 [Sphagnurus paluster]|uniref:Uncharacterized protein n=1 Tax=Sphagnurus paluster TaxID=117069 RepID=A0A9P7GKN5_9AGAR|nr:hypothetical protein H0H81_010163 [Sphagnurus paluster]
MFLLALLSLKASYPKASTQRTGVPISFRQARDVHGFIYGFPIDSDAIHGCGNRLFPTSPAITDSDDEELTHGMLMVQMRKVYSHLINKLCEVRHRDGISLPENGLYEFEDDADETMWITVLALVACDWRNDTYIPADDQLEQIQNILEEEGFKGNPRWFVST